MANRVYCCFPGGKHKALTMSYDDGKLQDRRLVEIFNRYGIRGTFNLMAGKDLLSYFFQSILARPDYPNYIIFTSQNEENIRRLLKTLMMECYLGDSYHNLCGISLVNILMCYMLRHYSDTIQFYSYDFLSTWALLIMRYIQPHYQTVSLHELSQVFHYNEAYLSTLISKNAGMNSPPS